MFPFLQPDKEFSKGCQTHFFLQLTEQSTLKKQIQFGKKNALENV
jgi:hypothetical protein